MILMFSSPDPRARVTLDALDAGAVDYLPKNFEDIAQPGQGPPVAICREGPHHRQEQSPLCRVLVLFLQHADFSRTGGQQHRAPCRSRFPGQQPAASDSGAERLPPPQSVSPTGW